MGTRVEHLAVRAANRMSRRSFFGKTATVFTTVAAGSAMTLVLPAVRANALTCPPSTCSCGKRVVPGSCWYECTGRCCGIRVTQICDCCSGSNCNPNHLCTHSGCTLCAESFYTCLQLAC